MITKVKDCSMINPSYKLVDNGVTQYSRGVREFDGSQVGVFMI